MAQSRHIWRHPVPSDGEGLSGLVLLEDSEGTVVGRVCPLMRLGRLVATVNVKGAAGQGDLERERQVASPNLKTRISASEIGKRVLSSQEEKRAFAFQRLTSVCAP